MNDLTDDLHQKDLTIQKLETLNKDLSRNLKENSMKNQSDMTRLEKSIENSEFLIRESSRE